MVRVHLQHTFVQFLRMIEFGVLVEEFKGTSLEYPILMGTFEGSHIPIFALVIEGENYC